MSRKIFKLLSSTTIKLPVNKYLYIHNLYIHLIKTFCNFFSSYFHPANIDSHMILSRVKFSSLTQNRTHDRTTLESWVVALTYISESPKCVRFVLSLFMRMLAKQSVCSNVLPYFIFLIPSFSKPIYPYVRSMDLSICSGHNDK